MIASEDGVPVLLTAFDLHPDHVGGMTWACRAVQHLAESGQLTC